MKYVHLGGTNLKVSEFCLGAMMFGGKTPAEESIRILRHAVDSGVNFIDTADVYNSGRSEEIVGQALPSIRDKVVLASKVTGRTGEGPNDMGVSRYHIIRGVEESLKRLKTDRLDILYIHTPVEAMNLPEMLRAMEDLVRAGKVLYPACSNFPAWLLCRCLWLDEVKGYMPLVAGQYPYNLIERGLEVEVLPFTKAMHVGIVAYRPLSAGVLTGKYLDGIPSDARAMTDKRLLPWSERYTDSIKKLVAFSQERGYTAADAAIAWVRSHPAVTTVLLGISRMEQLVANLKAFEWEMTAEERQEVSSFFPTEVKEEAGGRFPAWRRSYNII